MGKDADNFNWRKGNKMAGLWIWKGVERVLTPQRSVRRGCELQVKGQEGLAAQGALRGGLAQPWAHRKGEWNLAQESRAEKEAGVTI